MALGGWALALGWAHRFDEQGQLPLVAGVARRIAHAAAKLRCALDFLQRLV